MTDQNYEQDGYDLDEAAEVVDEAKAPKTKGDAKAVKVDSTLKSGDSTVDPAAEAKKGSGGTKANQAKNGDTSGQDPMQKPNAGTGYMKMENMTKLAALPADVINTLYQEAFGEDLDLDESNEELVEYNFTTFKRCSCAFSTSFFSSRIVRSLT